jgi:hypothetical protein
MMIKNTYCGWKFKDFSPLQNQKTLGQLINSADTIENDGFYVKFFKNKVLLDAWKLENLHILVNNKKYFGWWMPTLALSSNLFYVLSTEERTDFRTTQDWEDIENTVKNHYGNKCSHCGATGIRLHTHHTKAAISYDDKDPLHYEILCKECHMIFGHRNEYHFGDIAFPNYNRLDPKVKEVIKWI